MARLGFRLFRVALASSFMLVPGLAFAQLQNPFNTPGKAAKVSKEQVCSGEYAKSLKPLSKGDIENVLALYGLRPESGRQLYQLIPAVLGGSNDRDNLWPLPDSREFGPTQKKALDDKLHDMVCAGTIELKAAQDAVRKNWVEAYKKYAPSVGS